MPAARRGTKGRYLVRPARRSGQPVSPTGAPSAQRRRVYLDTSAYLCILLAEEGWQALSEQTDEAELLSSVLLVLEAKRNLISARARGAR
jgi:hypothetical protein